MRRTSIGKREREKAQRERTAAKAERRAARHAATDEETPAAPIEDQDAVLAELAALHARFDAGDLDLDEFTDAKQNLTQRLRVD